MSYVIEVPLTLCGKQRVILARLILSLSVCLGLTGCGGGKVPRALPSTSRGEPAPGAMVVSPTATPTAVAPIPQPETATASLRIVPAEAKVGDRLDVILQLTGAEALYGVEIHLSFDPSSVIAEDADPEMAGAQSEHGTLLNPDFVVRNVISETEGVIHYAISQMPPSDPASGEGVVMTAHLEASAAGELSVAVESMILADASGAVIPVKLKTREARLLIE